MMPLMLQGNTYKNLVSAASPPVAVPPSETSEWHELIQPTQLVAVIQC
jgi:hypothetical protein